MQNMNLVEFITQRQDAVGLDDLAELMPDGPPVPPPTERERVMLWIDDEDPLAGLRTMLHHLDSFWQRRDEPNVILLHYDDLKADLEGQMRALAKLLGIEVAEERWPSLVRAATFESMRDRAEVSAPNATKPIWLDTKRFFNKGTTGQWRELFDDELVAAYEARARSVAPGDLYDWAHTS